ncbi:MAG TPA: hypothetical protein DD400_05430 [Rhodospirillaceae bacterium]|nr:hypothetical protein [Rhodospirillaceae bacterium]
MKLRKYAALTAAASASAVLAFTSPAKADDLNTCLKQAECVVESHMKTISEEVKEFGDPNATKKYKQELLERMRILCTKRFGNKTPAPQ